MPHPSSTSSTSMAGPGTISEALLQYAWAICR